MSIPILTLASLVGIVAYIAIGCVVSSLHLKSFEDRWRYVKGAGWQWKDGSSWKPGDGAFAAGLICWPALALGWGLLGFFYFPVKGIGLLCSSISSYVAEIGSE